jgi:predicted nucleotidyltransferase
MSQKTKQALLESLPPSVAPRLEELERSLSASLGEELKALLVFGSAVRGDYRPGQSDIELMIVVKNATPEKLASIANAITMARYAVRVEPMILTADEIPRAADVYPLLYDSIRQSHTLLCGEDPFKNLTISDRHRRLRIEQELREAQIRLRRVITDSLGQPAAMVTPLVRKLRQIRAPLYALLRMRKIETGELLDDVLRAAGKTYEINISPLSKIKAEPLPAAATLIKLLDAAVHDVDRMDAEGDK